MFVLLFTYPSSEADRASFLDEHHEYLDRQYEAGNYVLWGAASGGRGTILVSGDDPDEVDALVAGDPFVRERLVECEVIHVDVSRTAIDLLQGT